MNILHEDEELLAVAKPSGQLVIPGRPVAAPSDKPGPGVPFRPDMIARDVPTSSMKEERDVAAREETLLDEVTKHLGGKAWVVHRLDRGASGLVVFAKNAEAHRRLSRQFEGREVKKTYLAVVKGDVPAGGVIDQPLRQFGSGRVAVDPRGKPSVTRYRVKDNFAGVTLLEVEPETGRQHQIRVHLYWLGNPILGETRYGKDFPVGGAPRLMLHAWRLRLLMEKGELLLEAPPPEDFSAYVFRV